jgi:hypothetical protein
MTVAVLPLDRVWRLLREDVALLREQLQCEWKKSGNDTGAERMTMIMIKATIKVVIVIMAIVTTTTPTTLMLTMQHS